MSSLSPAPFILFDRGRPRESPRPLDADRPLVRLVDDPQRGQRSLHHTLCCTNLLRDILAPSLVSFQSFCTANSFRCRISSPPRPTCAERFFRGSPYETLSEKKKFCVCAPIMISIILPCVSSELQGTRAPGTSLSTSEPFLAHSANTHSAIPSSSYQRARALPTWGLDVAVFGESKSRSAHTAVVKTPPYQTPSARQRRQARNGGSFDGPSPQLSRLGSFFVLDIEFTASSSFSGMTHPTGDSPSNQASRSASSHGTHSFFFSSDLSRSPQGFLHRTATRA